MEKVIAYPLSEKEQKIITDARQVEINTCSWYHYLSFCLGTFGAENASDWAYDESKDERRHFNKIGDYLKVRGYEPEMPAIAQPIIEFTDMKSGLLAALNKEVELAEMYDEWIDDLKKLSGANMTIQLFLEMLDIQKWSIDELRKIWLQIEPRNDKADQLEFDLAYFAPKHESSPI